ncbi:Dipeptidyl aminopeptidase/acylaminoacyl peptidase [Pedobacter hartonius]|uniref:Dipeptidyl aminopeptidase/acylaminoacyl peptidase n=1 Tax=Pedobacter hartonius TaxID=425514 RepID=A0A1H4CXI6_9SPHI|nr:Dipeptidyl aminopeptidase/acylaminoacyl peptidase [Pedobacter hartonius]
MIILPDFKRICCVIFLFIAISAGRLAAQGRSSDFKRAGLIKNAMERNVLHAPNVFKWLVNGKKFWYLQRTQKGNEFTLVDVATGKRGAAFDQQKLALSLSKETGKKTDPYELPFQDIDFQKNDQIIAFTIDDTIWQFDLGSYQLINKSTVSTSGISETSSPVISPDGKWEAFIRNYNVYIKSISGADTIQLSADGSAAEYYSRDLKWSPDSKKLADYKIKPVKTRQVYLIESSPKDQLQPKLHSRSYAKPGDSLPVNTPCLFHVEEKKQVPVTGVPIDMAYNLSAIKWQQDSRAFTFEYNKRGFQLFQVLQADAASGQLKPLITETSPTFIASQKRYCYDVSDGQEMIWASERDGWNHLYLYDRKTGKVKNQITKGDWVVRKVVSVNIKDRTIVFEGSGREAGQNPYLIHYYRINFDGSKLQLLTPENADHTAFFSNDGSCFVDTYSRMDLPPVAVLRNAADGTVMMPLEKADITGLLSTGWKMPEVFHAKGRDGVTDIWGTIIRPVNFDPQKKYPVIEYIYAGPHNSFVPSKFIGETQSGDYRSKTALHELAELGFIVVQMDGMGTSNRSKAFHDVCWKNLKDAGFPDRIRWIKAAAKQYPYMDISRMGIYGNSAGGQNSVAALLFHPEFYKVAVSSSGCHDNRMDKIGWNESWMGYPVGPQYEASSNVTHAKQLQGKLLLILGEMDTNVPPESTLQLVDKLIEADKDFDFLMIPGMGHSLGGDYGEHKRRDFFVKNLMGITPPVW